MIRVKYLNNNNFRFSFIGVINIRDFYENVHKKRVIN